MRMLTDAELEKLTAAEDATAPTPLPVQVVSSDEFFPVPQTERQRRVEARLNELADAHGAPRGLSRRAFFKTASGMAAAFVAMNDVYGGAANRGKTAVLPKKTRLKTVEQNTMEQSQFQELRDAILADVCRCWGVPSTLLGDQIGRAHV